MAGEYEYGHVDFLQDEAILPRYFLGDPRPTLHRRQSDKCEAGHHQCVDIGFPGTCCPNDRYCYVDPEARTARCCPLELNCDSECGSTRFRCDKTTTRAPPTESPDAPPVTTVQPACCARACTSQSFYRCEASQGGQCCPYDNACDGSVCVSTITSTPPPLVTPVDEGCTTNQFRCDDGEGCCDNTRKCATLSGTAVCAPAEYTGPGTTVDVPSSAGLSDGAKAGIGVGVAIGVSVITAGLTFLFLRRRARKRALARAREDEAAGGPDDQTLNMELTTPETHDYFGPDATAGPFTGAGPTPSPGARETGVPAQPNAPDDIVVPVEIDSTGVTPVPKEDEAARPVVMYELYGSDVPEMASPVPELASPNLQPASPVPVPEVPSPDPGLVSPELAPASLYRGAVTPDREVVSPEPEPELAPPDREVVSPEPGFPFPSREVVSPEPDDPPTVSQGGSKDKTT
ncbi:uncharacterized protein DNG_00903 [Cephalotrichum gorgonifer]|uniref:Uncharacterized protein n=1 Tax=Cephalotrichum gorgonifer TaxID=2041049 RepID=A0AAE8SRC0_9PEZI|nr:uncharacterized protein DNG_00903 [Cephalotrichum gorgonifer]